MASPIVLCDTAGMTNERWLECRMHGPKGDIPYTVGGSDVAAIFGVSPWTTPLELWMIKKGKMKPAVKANANQLQMGHFNRSQLISMQSKREIPCSMIPICISTQIIHTHLPILTVVLSELLTASREYWSVNPAPIIMLLIGQTEPILFTMNCSSDFILPLLMSISARSPLSGGIIPIRIWQCPTLFGTEIRKT